MGGVGNEGNPKLIYSDGESRYIVVYINGHMVLRYPIYRYLDPRGPRLMEAIRIQAPKASTMPGDLAKKVILERLQTLGFLTHGDEVWIPGVDSSAESLEVFVGKLLEISVVKATVSRNVNLNWNFLVELV